MMLDENKDEPADEFNPDGAVENEGRQQEHDAGHIDSLYSDAFADEENPYSSKMAASDEHDAEKNLNEKQPPKPAAPQEKEKDEEGSIDPPDFMSDDADSKGQGRASSEKAAEEKPANTTADEKKQDIKYDGKKISAQAADSIPHSKPKQLNKRFLLAGIIILFGGVFLVTFLMPSKGQKKKKEEKPVAVENKLGNYEAYAQKRPEEETSPTDTGSNSAEAEKKEDVEEVKIPPVVPPSNESTRQPYTQSTTSYSGGSSNKVEIPDTRNDRLQGKSISGIKGLTSTQKKYQTDYDDTVAKNTSSSASSSGYSLPSKDEYMKNVMSAYSSAYGNATSQNNGYSVQNDQEGKSSFYNNGRDSQSAGTGTWLGLNTIWQGTIFEATLTSELNTDLPGEITARTAKNIYSSQDGRYLLIPQNSILYGTYNSSISYSQSRVQVVWNKLVRPDGYAIDLGSMNATDAKGASGVGGFVNDHPLAYLKAIGLMSVFSIMNTEFATANSDTDNEYVQNVIANSQQVTNDISDKLIDRALNVQPTIKVKAGTKINIVANQTLSIPPCEQIPVTQQYRRQ